MSDLENEIRDLLADHGKIAAVKHYRAATGVGLAEAKEAVERIERGEPPAPSKPSDSDFEAEIVSLLGRGEKIAAIRLYRERTGTGLKESKEAVNAIGEKHGISAPTGSGCLGILLFLAALTACITVVVVSIKFS